MANHDLVPKLKVKDVDISIEAALIATRQPPSSLGLGPSPLNTKPYFEGFRVHGLVAMGMLRVEEVLHPRYRAAEAVQDFLHPQ